MECSREAPLCTQHSSCIHVHFPPHVVSKDHAIRCPCMFDRNFPVQHVSPHSLRLAFERIAETTTASHHVPVYIASAQRNGLHRHRWQNTLPRLGADDVYSRRARLPAEQAMRRMDGLVRTDAEVDVIGEYPVFTHHSEATAILTGTARVRRESIPLDADRIVGFDHLHGDVGLVGRHVWHTFLTVMP